LFQWLARGRMAGMYFSLREAGCGVWRGFAVAHRPLPQARRPVSAGKRRSTAMSSLRTGPDNKGLFGRFGGQFVAETLMPLINELAAEYEKAKVDPAFLEELGYFHRDYIGRASPLYYAERLSEHFGGAKIYLKREDLNHTGAHKINNCIGQILL